MGLFSFLFVTLAFTNLELFVPIDILYSTRFMVVVNTPSELFYFWLGYFSCCHAPHRGFEPRFTDSKSVVLPLDEWGLFPRFYFAIDHSVVA